MSNYASLKATISANIKANGNQEITGPVLQAVLNSIVNTLGTGYQYKGVATPTSNPGTPDERVFYIASTPGTYTNLGNLVVADGEVAILKFDTIWRKDDCGIASKKMMDFVKSMTGNVLEWEQGTFDGNGQEAYSSLQLRSKAIAYDDIYSASANTAGGFDLWVWYYNEDGTYIGRDNALSSHPAKYAYTVRFSLQKEGVQVTDPEMAGFSMVQTKEKVLGIIADIATLASKSEVTAISDKVDAISKLLNTSISYQTPSIQRANSRINDEGAVVSSSGYDITTPIALQKGETIIFDGLVSLVCAAISVTDSAGSSYNVKVMGGASAIEVLEYRYTATEDCYVALCYNKQNAPSRFLIVKSEYLSDLDERITTTDGKISGIEGALAKPIRIVRGGWYNTFVSYPGQSASMAFTSTYDYASVIVNASKGDVFYLTGTGGTSPKLWALIENDSNVVIAVSANGATASDLRIDIPKDCRLVVNVRTALAYGLFKVDESVASVVNIEPFSKLNKLNSEPLFKVNYFLGFAGIIHHWGFIGDSLMGGYMENSGLSEYEYSWGQRMCQLLGVKGYNFSVGGQTTKGWIEGTDARTWAGAKTNLKQAYIIGLGVNDRNQSYGVGDVSTDIGTYDPATDTDTNAATFAGYYAGIIQRLQSVNPTAKIFVVTMPYNVAWANVNNYNEVIRGMAGKFSNVYVVDLYTYADNFYTTEWNNDYFESGHFNVIGYEYAASVMMTYLDWIIRNNYAAFENVNLIPFTAE